ncbi:hypothetical protein AB833_25695 [Chromatiales bacterium (ex Bugula neritina AB1)]|nr:hypothetical protein AB833_25695 [Chromatiales bacterium (ex Bugula neritina AB1)]
MRYLLMLQNASARAYAVGRHGFGQAVQFDNSPGGRKNLARYLHERRLSVFTVLVDFTEEELHRKTIPFVRGTDRRSILARMQQRSFPGSKLSCVRTRANKQNGKRELDVTVAGIVSNSECESWFEVLREARTVVANVCSLSLLGSGLCEALGVSAVYKLVAIQLTQSDYRLCAYHDNLPLISRRVSIPGNKIDTLTEEIQQTLSYLARQVGMPDVVVETIVVGNFTKEQIEQVVGQVEHSRVLDLDQAAGVLNLSKLLPVSYADGLFATLLRGRPARKADLSKKQHRRFYLRKRVTHGLYASGICLLLSAVVSTVATAHINHEYQALADSANRFSNISSKVDTGLSRKIYVENQPVDAVRESVRIARILEANARYTPFHFMSAFAADLAPFPMVKIESINWTQPYGSNSVQTSPTATGLTQGSDTVMTGHVTVSGSLKGDGEEISAALGVFQRFVSSLSNSGVYQQVVVLESPYSLSGNRVTMGNGFDGVAGNARFMIELTIVGSN